MMNKKGGMSVFSIIILGIIIVLTINYFQIDIKGMITGTEAKINGSGDQKINLNSIEEKIKGVWDKYFKKSAISIWEKISNLGNETTFNLDNLTNLAPPALPVDIPSQQ